MEKIKLKNGLTVIYQEKNTNSVAIEVLVKVGSNNETLRERGISHFIEHMLFEGTKKRKNSAEIANEIEKLGGELNAYTTKERTCFFVKLLKKHFDKGLDVLSDILQNPVFGEKEIKKEKKIVEKEIDLVNDEPRYYQWILFEKNLYNKHPTKFPTYGSKKVIENLKRKDIVDYYNKYYSPKNMIISIVGKVKDWKKKVETSFSFKTGKIIKAIKIREELAKRNKIRRERKKITNTYMILGYRTVPLGHPDSYILEVINGVLGRGQSGWMFNEIRGKRGLAYEVGTQHINEKDYGYFAIYLNTDRKKISLARKLILEQLGKLKNLSDKELEEAKTYIEGDFLLEVEDNQRLADNLCFLEQVENVKLINSFLNIIKKVSVNDVKRVVDKYFNNYCMTVVEGK